MKTKLIFVLYYTIFLAPINDKKKGSMVLLDMKNWLTKMKI